jgi:branched-chain amino acid transport system ATP-binding protein
LLTTTISIGCESIASGYGDLPAIRDISLSVHPGEVVALLGPNGAGKTTTLLAMTGELPLMSGRVIWEGQPIRPRLHIMARRGLAWVPDDRGVFRSLSVLDNLLLGRGDPDAALAVFPQLAGLLKRRAGLLSGGEQQMLALGRALAGRPSVLILDELSLGLSPLATLQVFDALRLQALDTQIAVLMVEQQARRALDLADRWYLLGNGRVVAQGTADEADRVEDLYLPSAAVHHTVREEL